MTSPADQAVEEALNKPVEELTLGEGSSTSKHEEAGRTVLNGHHADDAGSGAEVEANGETSIGALKAELERMKDERDSFEGQYHGLLSKLGQMRSTLGDRLRQDAEELDRREQQIDTLTARVDELGMTVKTLEGELVTSHEDVDRLAKELDTARSLQQSSSTTDRKGAEVRLRELQEMAERYRIEAESWESACMEERAYRDDLDLQVREARRERDEAATREQEQANMAAREADTARELQQILEEFQAAQEGELQRAVGDHEEKLTRLTALLEESQTRTEKAETLASKYKGEAERCQSLEREVKEKNLLIGKLRHEAVILNEHLTESLRRLRTNQSDSNVDGKLITNLLIQFLNTPRSDTKRFEMLNLIASVLNWTAEDREKAGLQRNSLAAADRKLGVSATREGHKRNNGASQNTNEESFSNLFVEFLLSEAEKAKQPSTADTASATAPSTPGTPKSGFGRPSFNLSSLASLNRGSIDDANVRSPESKESNAGSPRAVRSP